MNTSYSWLFFISVMICVSWPMSAMAGPFDDGVVQIKTGSQAGSETDSKNKPSEDDYGARLAAMPATRKVADFIDRAGHTTLPESKDKILLEGLEEAESTTDIIRLFNAANSPETKEKILMFGASYVARFSGERDVLEKLAANPKMVEKMEKAHEKAFRSQFDDTTGMSSNYTTPAKADSNTSTPSPEHETTPNRAPNLGDEMMKTMITNMVIMSALDD